MGKAFQSNERKHGRRVKTLALFLGLTLLLAAAVGTTVAYLVTSTPSLVNVFLGSKADCGIVEKFDGEKKTDVSIKNTGDVESYIRAALVISWVTGDGRTVHAQKPIEDTDYTMTFPSKTDWEYCETDGFWYYKKPVAAGETTGILIQECAALKEGPEGYWLSVEILASSIQASPETAVTTKWSSGVDKVEDTKLVIKKEVPGT